MVERITEEELEFMEDFHDPIAFAECMFSDFDNLQILDKNFGHIRNAQIPMISYEYMIDTNEDLSEKENFKLLENTGNIYNFGARRYGKTLVTLLIDMLTSIVHHGGWKTIFSSYDAVHIRKVLELFIPICENHPILKLFRPQVKRSPTYFIRFDNGFVIESVNMNVASKNPGAQFFGHHVKKHWMEESSKEIEKVEEKRIDAVSELGCIERFCVSKGSKIMLSDFTTKNIELIEIGDKIIAWNSKNRRLEETIVKNRFDSGIRDVIKLKNSKDELWLTPEHKIWCKRKTHYGWRKASVVEDSEYYSNWINYIYNKEDYYKGVLIGLLDSDGRCQITEGKTQICYQYSISQANEVLFCKFVLDYLKIEYSEDIDSGQRTGTFTSKDKPIHTFRIKRKYNNFIKDTYSILELNRDIQLGYIGGFIIGDGWIDDSASLIISQTVSVSQLKIDRIITVTKKLNIFDNCKCSITKKGIWKIYFPKYSTVLPPNSVKGIRYREILLNTERYGHKAEKLFIDGKKEKIQVYDIETDLYSFIANGFIIHNSGMTDFTKYSPAGKIFYNLDKKPWVCNFPQYINPTWDEKEKKKAIKRYGGEGSIGYRVFVKGEVVEDGISVFDMVRVRKNYDEEKVIKHLEIPKDKYSLYKEMLIVERPKNAEVLFISADIGESAPTEIIVISKVNDIYRYLYNITLYNLTDKEQTFIFKYLAEKLNANFIGLDTTDGTGRAIYRSLEEEYGKEHLVWVSFNAKIPVDFEKDEFDKSIFKDGKPLYVEEYVSEWSIKHLKDLLYGEKMNLPLDFKLDTQLNSVISTQSLNRTLYKCVSEEDHLFAAFCVFSISEWSNFFNLINPINKKTFFKGGI